MVTIGRLIADYIELPTLIGIILKSGAGTMVGVDTGMSGTALDIDWIQCELIEQIPGKVSGRPTVRDTRILPDPIVNSYDLGDSIEEIREGFPMLSVDQIKRLIEFAHAQRGQQNL